MNTTEQEAILTLCLMAAFADGGKSDLERAELKRIADSFPNELPHAPQIYQNVLLRRVTLGQAAAPLTTPELRQLAYEMAVCVCDADDTLSPAEQQFLASLRSELKLDGAAPAAFQSEAEAITAAPLSAPLPAAAVAVPPIIAAAAAGTAGAILPVAADAELDRSILNYSILNGALELLPESIATMAIVPLQMKMVYEIGGRHGYKLDRGHIKELLAAAGIGITSQVVEGYARKLVGGLVGKFIGGGMARSVADQVTSSAMSFASTYALGQLARRYYAGGRSFSTTQMKDSFQSLLGEAKGLHSRYLPDIQRRAREVNVSQLLPLLRGGR